MKSKIIILPFIFALLITGCNNKNTSLDNVSIRDNALTEIYSLVSDEKFSEAKAVLDFANKQINTKIENIAGTIDYLTLAKDSYEKGDYENALTNATYAYDAAKGEQMTRAASDFKEKITQEQKRIDEKDSNKENIQDVISTPIAWDYVNASSYLPHKSKNYKPESAIDGSNDTAWFEYGEGKADGHEDGIGEYIELKSNNIIKIDKISMTNGFTYDEEKYMRNNRIKDIEIKFYYGGNLVSTKPYTFKDNHRELVDIKIPGGIQADSIRIYIGSVYTKDRIDTDTCISELIVYGEVLNQ